MDRSGVNLEADYCGNSAIQYTGKPRGLSGNNTNVARKLVCNANMGPISSSIRTSVSRFEEKM